MPCCLRHNIGRERGKTLAAFTSGCKSCISEVIKFMSTGPNEKWIVSDVHLIHSLLAGNLTPISHCHRSKVTSPQHCNISTFSFAFLFDSPSDKMSNVMTYLLAELVVGKNLLAFGYQSESVSLSVVSNSLQPRVL